MQTKCDALIMDQAGVRCCSELDAVLSPDLFRALCDPSRLAVVSRLADLGKPSTVSEISACCPVDMSGVSRHLATLRRAGILASERKGKEVRYRILASSVAATLRRIADAIDACCPPEKEGEEP